MGVNIGTVRILLIFVKVPYIAVYIGLPDGGYTVVSVTRVLQQYGPCIYGVTVINTHDTAPAEQS